MGVFLYLKKYLNSPLISGTIILVAASLLSRLLGFIYRVFLNNLLGPEGLGLYQLIMPLLSLCLAISCMAFQTIISRLVSEYPDRKYLTLLCGIFFSSILSAGLAWLVHHNSTFISLAFLEECRCIPLIKLMAYALIPASIHSCINGFYYGIKKASIPAISQLLEQIGRIGSIFLIYQLVSQAGDNFTVRHSVIGISLGELCSSLFSLSSIALRKEDKTIELKGFSACSRKICRLYMPYSLNYLVITLSSTFESILLPRFLRDFGLSVDKSLSIYGTFSGLTMPILLMPSMVSSCAATLILPAVSEAKKADNSERIQALTGKISAFAVCFGVFCTAGFYIFSSQLGYLLFRSPLCGLYLKQLCWICPFMQLNILLSGILNGLGCEKKVLAVNLGMGVIRILSIIYFVPGVGIAAYMRGMLVAALGGSAVLGLVLKGNIRRTS